MARDLSKLASDDLVMLWIEQNDAVQREADQKAFDALPSEIRAIVNNSPVQLACAPLLYGCRKYGAPVMAEACSRLLSEWVKSKEGA